MGKKKSGIAKILDSFYGDGKRNSSDMKQALLKFYVGEEEVTHSYSEITRYLIEKNMYNEYTTEDLAFLIESLEGIRYDESSNEDNILKINVEKLLDHLKLEQYRMNYMDEKAETVNEAIDGKLSEVEKELKNSKFDLIALTTLVFTAFTFLSTNVSIITAILGAKEFYHSIYEILVVLIIGNTMILLSIFFIYTIIRKIHGDISENTMYKYIKRIGICFFVIALFLSTLVYFSKR